MSQLLERHGLGKHCGGGSSLRLAALRGGGGWWWHASRPSLAESRHGRQRRDTMPRDLLWPSRGMADDGMAQRRGYVCTAWTTARFHLTWACAHEDADVLLCLEPAWGTEVAVSTPDRGAAEDRQRALIYCMDLDARPVPYGRGWLALPRDCVMGLYMSAQPYVQTRYLPRP